jgi:hypothetical protein
MRGISACDDREALASVMDLITRIWFDALAGVLKIVRNQIWTQGASSMRWGKKLKWSQRRPAFSYRPARRA